MKNVHTSVQKVATIVVHWKNYSLALKYSSDVARIYYNRGLSYTNLQQYQLAYKDFTSAINLDSNSDDAYWSNRGTVLSELKRPEEAIADYTKAISLDGNDFTPLYNRGYDYVQLHRYKDALIDFEHAELLMYDQDSESKARLYFYRGLALHQTGYLEDAVDNYSKAIDLYQDDYVYMLNRAQALADLHRDEAAFADYAYLIKTHPEEGEIYFDRGTDFLDREQYREALTDFNTAIAHGYKTPKTYNNRANARKRLDDKNGAIKDYNKAIELDTAYLNRASTFRSMNDFDAALDVYQQLAQLWPDSAETYFNRGNLRLQMDNYEGALKDYNKAILRAPAMADAYTNRATVELHFNKTDEARDDYTKAIVLAPNDPLPYLQRGRIDDDNVSSLQDLQYAVALDKHEKYPDDRFSLAIAEQKSGMLDDALAHYQYYILHDNKNSIAYDNMAYIYFERSSYEKAIELFNKGLRLDTKGIDAMLGLSMVYFKLNRMNDANNAIDVAIKINSALKDGMKGIAILEANGFFYNEKQKKILAQLFQLRE